MRHRFYYVALIALVPMLARTAERLHGVDMTGVRWTQGFWAERFDLCYRTIIPSLWEDLQIPNNGATYRNFLVAAGIETGKHQATWWGDGDFYKWIETVAHVYALTRDPALDRRMDEVIAVVARAQAADGYISTPIQIQGLPRWRNFNHHELYNMGHLMTAATVHHRATGKESLLIVAKKNADYLYTVFAPRPPELAHFCFNPSQIMGLVELYRTTRNPKYLELAGIFVDMRGSRPGGSDQNQARVPLRKETEAVGHAVTGPYLWAGAADVYAETGEKALWDALDRLWRDVTGRKMFVTGAVGAVNVGASPRGNPTHEAFGLGYELPNRIAYNETCANIANAMWNWRMLAATGEARFADVMELVLYNSMLSGMSLAGTEFFYANPLRRLADTQPMLRNESLTRWRNNTEKGASTSWCCPPNLSRMLASLHQYAYSVSEGRIWVNLYGANTLQTRLPGGVEVALKQDSGYPWDGAVRITMGRGGEFAVMLRIPGWAEGAAIKVNGRPFGGAPVPASYAELRRKWSAGDRLELELPMPARLVVAHPAVEAARNHVAVMRGPIVYCLESPDLPTGVGFHDVALPPDARFTARFDKVLLGGVTVLEGQARVRPEPPWTGLLYQPLKAAKAGTSTIRLIPYYAWGNRGVSYMSVWLPRAD